MTFLLFTAIIIGPILLTQTGAALINTCNLQNKQIAQSQFGWLIGIKLFNILTLGPLFMITFSRGAIEMGFVGIAFFFLLKVMKFVLLINE